MLETFKKANSKGIISDQEYTKQLHKSHLELYDYADFIKMSNCREILIKDGEVIFALESENILINMTCPKNDRTSVPFTFFAFDDYDCKVTNFLCSLIKEGDTVLDVGANVGWFTLHFLKLINNINVYSFEPIEPLWNSLNKNMYLNGFDSTHCYNACVSDIDDTIDFYHDKDRFGASSMVKLDDNALKDHELRRVRSITIDSLDLDNVKFMKIDVEGAEKLVIDGALKTIQRDRPIIYAELLIKWCDKFDYHPNKVIKTLSNIGYKCVIINNDFSFTKIKEITQDTTETNFLFICDSNY